MTYRSLFILADKLGDLMCAIRLRAGVSAHQPVRSARATTRALGGLLLYSFDLSQREYDILRLRGYEGRLRVTPAASRARGTDIASILVALAALGVSVAFRILPGLAGFGWLVTTAGIIVLAAGALLGRRTR
jgi:hypothetical protein